MEVIYILIGLVLGGLIAFLFASKKSSSQLIRLKTELDLLNKQLEIKNNEIETLNDNFKTQTINKNKEIIDLNTQISKSQSNLEKTKEKLEDQKSDITNLNDKFKTEFENLANKILEKNSEKFVDKNKTNLDIILNPFKENIEAFKKIVEEVYDKESKERFSLGDKVKDLVELHDRMSQETRNLTNALKGDSKTQGNWGEMILESILEKSGLEKNRHYFMENYLKDDNGNYLVNEEGKRMRPDAIIQYPDDRKVIVDSKVSLNAYVRFVESDDVDVQEKELKSHVNALKTHITTLSNKTYDNFSKSLDFVMMFVPNESAYVMALKQEPELWHFAYEKRIILISPTNLITSLKLIQDLWKRDAQNKNAMEIAERGGKLYDKFVGFSDTLQKVGNQIDSAKDSYNKAYGQLCKSGGIVRQVEMLQNLGVKNKKTINSNMLDENN